MTTRKVWESLAERSQSPQEGRPWPALPVIVYHYIAISYVPSLWPLPAAQPVAM